MLRSETPDETWSVVVLYDDAPTRQRAMGLCNRLVQRFWEEVEIRFHWWRSDFLVDDLMRTTATQDAVGADFIVVSSRPEQQFSPFVVKWFEDWIRQREGREGAFLDLTEPEAGSADNVQRRQLHLRRLAHRAMMDYLTQVSQIMDGPLPDSFESVEHRAAQITSVMDQILHLPPPPRLDLPR
ncbi:MAG: hypothetical protein KIS67_16865 [Verrucomicrobiae bacterium]|nr:hypothetical protein [Verrucomicrobiae bacterium]